MPSVARGPDKRRRAPRRDRRLTAEQAREVRSSRLTLAEMAWLLKQLAGIQISTVALWKIRANLVYREIEP